MKLPDKLNLLVTGTARRTTESEADLLLRTEDATLHFRKDSEFGKLAHALVDSYNERKAMPKKVFIEVRGGMIQNIQSTSEDVIIYVKDYDQEPREGQAEDDDELGWQYWEAKGGNQIVDEKTFEDAIVNANN